MKLEIGTKLDLGINWKITKIHSVHEIGGTIHTDCDLQLVGHKHVKIRKILRT